MPRPVKLCQVVAPAPLLLDYTWAWPQCKASRAVLCAGSMPTDGELAAGGYGSLLTAVRRCGGFHVVASSLGLAARASQRRRHGTWRDPQQLAEELHAFASSAAAAVSDSDPSDAVHSSDNGLATLHLPSRQQLEAAGRQDLLYAVRRARATAAMSPDGAVAGLRPTSRRGTQRNTLRLERIAVALQVRYVYGAKLRL
jgi:hypothetical protein